MVQRRWAGGRAQESSLAKKGSIMLRRWQSVWVRYGVAIASLVVAAVARWLLSYLYGVGVYPVAPIFLAVIFSAWYGGFGPPIFVAALGLVLAILTPNSRGSV